MIPKAKSTVCKGFVRFRSGKFDLEDRENSSKLTTVDDEIETVIKNNPGHTALDIVEVLHIYICCKSYENTWLRE